MEARVVLLQQRQGLRADAEGGRGGEVLVLADLAVLQQGGRGGLAGHQVGRHAGVVAGGQT